MSVLQWWKRPAALLAAGAVVGLLADGTLVGAQSGGNVVYARVRQPDRPEHAHRPGGRPAPPGAFGAAELVDPGAAWAPGRPRPCGTEGFDRRSGCSGSDGREGHRHRVRRREERVGADSQGRVGRSDASLPAGRYFVTAKASLQTDNVKCKLLRVGKPADLDAGSVGSVEHAAGTVSLQRLQLFKTEGKMRLTCVNQSNQLTFASNRRITAVAVDGFLELGS